MKKDEFIKRKKYNDVSGISSYIDPRINVKMNEYGYYEEFLDEDVEEVLEEVIFVSPNLNDEINEYDIAKKHFEATARGFDKDIGYYQALYVGHVKEGKYRDLGSSGGIATWLLVSLLEKGLIDGVIHVKHSPNDETLFKYDISRTKQEIIEGSKTKYYPVELSKVLPIIEQTPGRYALVGVPSFIMSIRLLSEINPIIKDRIKYTVGLICGHQKSSKFTECMAWESGIEPGDLQYVDYRLKANNNSPGDYHVLFRGKINGESKEIIKPAKSLIGQDWGQGYFKIPASDYTDDVFNETADITLGDAWLKEYSLDDKGNNIIIVRNDEIRELLTEGEENGKVSLDTVTEEMIKRSQLAHIRHTKTELAYRLYKLEKEGQWIPNKRVKPSPKIPKDRRKIQDLRAVISRSSHENYLRAVNANDFDIFVKKMKKPSQKYRKIYLLNRIKRKGLKGSLEAFARKIKRLFK